MGAIEHEGDTFVLEDIVDELPRGPGAYRPRAESIDEVIYHQTAGGRQPGLAGPRNTATFHTAPPVWATNPDGTVRRDRRGKRILVGGGRAWPGIAYHVFVPFAPSVVNGKGVVYRTQLDGTVSYHTGGRANRHGIGVAFQGLFATRHGRIPDASEGPSEAQCLVRDELHEYLAGLYGMQPGECIRGHFDYGKVSCPGDEAETWVRRQRGEDFEVLTRPKPEAPLSVLRTWAGRERALWLVGFLPEAPDGVYDYKTRAAVERFQVTARIVVDGLWGPQTEAAVRDALDASGRAAETPAFLDPAAQPTLWTG